MNRQHDFLNWGKGAEDVYQGTKETRVSLDKDERARPTALMNESKEMAHRRPPRRKRYGREKAFKKTVSSVNYSNR